MANKPKIGLALGGGGAKGLSHIGVLEELIENRIPIDYIAGTSMGSVVGAYYALHLEIKGLEGLLLGLGKKGIFKLVDLAFPTKAIFSGERLRRFINTLVSNKHFSDTKIPLQIIATDLINAKEVRLSSGKLADAVRASTSVPGIFKPVKIGGKILVDGGLVNPTPVDVVKEMGADIVIGVDNHMEPKTNLNNPSIIDTLLQSYEIMRKQALKYSTQKTRGDVVIIRPYTKGVMGAYDFLNKRFIMHGRNAAKKSMPKIKRMINSRNG